MDPVRETRAYASANAKSFAPKYGETVDLAFRVSSRFTSYWSSRRANGNSRLSMPIIPIIEISTILHRPTSFAVRLAFLDALALIELSLASDDSH